VRRLALSATLLVVACSAEPGPPPPAPPPAGPDAGAPPAAQPDGGAGDDGLLGALAQLGAPARVDHFLALGLDSQTLAGGRTDTMMIVVADYRRRRLGVISVPRDLWVLPPGETEGMRINSVFALGERKRGKGGGRELLGEVLAAELGVDIQGYAAIDYTGFVRIIDALGGVPVRVRCPIEDRFIDATAPDGYRPLSLTAGAHELDGATALLYSRSRHGRSDWDRAERQQAVLAGLRQRAMSLGVLGELPALWKELSRSVRTDLSTRRLFRLATLALTVPREKIHGFVLREPLVDHQYLPDGRQVLFMPDRAKVLAEIADLFRKPVLGEGRKRARCPAADAALRWRELKRADRPEDDTEPPVVLPGVPGASPPVVAEPVGEDRP